MQYLLIKQNLFVVCVILLCLSNATSSFVALLCCFKHIHTCHVWNCQCKNTFENTRQLEIKNITQQKQTSFNNQIACMNILVIQAYLYLLHNNIRLKGSKLEQVHFQNYNGVDAPVQSKTIL